MFFFTPGPSARYDEYARHWRKLWSDLHRSLQELPQQTTDHYSRARADDLLPAKVWGPGSLPVCFVLVCMFLHRLTFLKNWVHIHSFR